MQLESPAVRLTIDDATGAVTGLFDKHGGVELVTEPRLADGFRLLLPLPDVRANYVLGREQSPPTVSTIEHGVELRWVGPLRNERGEFDVDVTLSFQVIGEAVRFRAKVRNGTPHTLAEVWFASVGGITGLAPGAEGRQTEALVPIVNKHWSQPIFRDFGNTRGQLLGQLGGEHLFFYPGGMTMPWVSLFHRSRNRGLYAAALEATPRVKGVRFALDPGIGDQRPDGNWPRAEEVGDAPLGLTMNWVHFPYAKPGETFESAPVILRFHDGDWKTAAALYREWFGSRYEQADHRRHPIRSEPAFLFRMCLLPEDNLNMRFDQIPRWAKVAADHGIRHVQVGGWQVGGHDRGYPQYTPDPRLGTWDDLAAAVKACHGLGVAFSFFINCQCVDLTTDWYKRELHRYRFEDPFGEPFFVVNYWGMGTLGARNKWGSTPHYEINPAHKEVRELLIRQFVKLVEIGADALHIDKFFQTPFDFNPRLKDTSPDRAHHEGILRFIEELGAACREVNPNCAISYEGGWDRLFSHMETVWWGNGEDTAMKEAFPQLAMIHGIEQPYDFNKVNRAALQGEILLVGPANYNMGLDYPPMRELARYIAEVTRIRRDLWAVVSGERLDASHGIFKRAEPLLRVEGDFAQSPHARWSVFRDPWSGRRAAVLANLSAAPLRAERIGLTKDAPPRVLIHQPFEPLREAAGVIDLTIPAERVAFVVEA